MKKTFLTVLMMAMIFSYAHSQDKDLIQKAKGGIALGSTLGLGLGDFYTGNLVNGFVFLVLDLSGITGILLLVYRYELIAYAYDLSTETVTSRMGESKKLQASDNAYITSGLFLALLGIASRIAQIITNTLYFKKVSNPIYYTEKQKQKQIYYATYFRHFKNIHLIVNGKGLSFEFFKSI